MGNSDAYLPHLDGLRAIALMGVLLFHFRVPHFEGGFAGVDVFLSISGFLITRNILRDVRNHSFSLSAFYKRRFFRLYPASVAVVLITLLLAFLGFPSELTYSVAGSAVATMLFFSNVFFHIQSGYFDEASVTKPLLHTWSLSLEEQFYFVWPVMIMFASHFTHNSKALVQVLGAMLVASFSFAVGFSKHYPSLVFYELPARIWQFAAGALVGFLSSHLQSGSDYVPQESTEKSQYLSGPALKPTRFAKETRDPSQKGSISEPNVVSADDDHRFLFRSSFSELLAVISVAGLLLSYVLLPPKASPLLMAATTIFTCCLLLLPQTIVSVQMLSSPLLCAVGRLSYSAYLVHWPLYVYTLHTTKGFVMGEPNPIFLVALTLLVAALLRKCVEEPVRRGRNRVTFSIAAVLTICLACAGLATEGFSFRFGEVNTNISNIFVTKQLRLLCKDGKEQTFIFSNRSPSGCRVGDESGKRSKIAFFGDSFTIHLSGALDEIGKKRGVWYGLHYRTSCKFLPQGFRGIVANSMCLAAHDRLWNELKQLPNGSIIAVANSWAAGGSPPMDKVLPTLAREVRALGHDLMIIGEPPGGGGSARSYFACADLAVMPLAKIWAAITRKKFLGASRCADLKQGLEPLNGRRRQQSGYHRILTSIEPRVKFVNLFAALCKGPRREREKWLCRLPVELDGIIYDIGYRRDLHHLTLKGSKFLSTIYEEGIYGGGVRTKKRIST